jgi:hypothetical protein
MSMYNGFVAKISYKEGTSKRGKWRLYSAKIEKEDGTEYDDWISFGFDKPTVNEGDYVSIETEADDKGYQKVKSVKKLKNPPAKAAVPTTSGASTPAAASRDASIHYQSSRKDAIAVLGLLIAKDALPLTQAKVAAGVAKRYEEIMALVDKLTVRYYFDIGTQRVLANVADEGAVETDVGQVPDQENDNAATVEEDDA